MHHEDIVYRDLKPENFIVNTEGYLKLIGMGAVKILKKSNYHRTRTIIGTPHYMAPEVISSKGHSFPVDIWALGIILYELVCGYMPFDSKKNDPLEIYSNILNSTVAFPEYIKDNDVIEIISKMLSKNPEDRMRGGYNELKRMKFFNGMDWLSL